MVKYTGAGEILDSDYKKVKYVGLTKEKKPVTIELPQAANFGNIDWAFAEKDDLVSEIVYTGVYENTDGKPESNDEPWSVEVDGSIVKGAANIMVGVGKIYINDELIGLTRGGGKFTVEREVRHIAADGDRGIVKGRSVIDAATPTLTLNTIEIIANLQTLYAGIKQVETSETEI